MAERLTTNQEVAGSTPAKIIPFFALLVFGGLLWDMTRGLACVWHTFGGKERLNVAKGRPLTSIFPNCSDALSVCM